MRRLTVFAVVAGPTGSLIATSLWTDGRSCSERWAAWRSDSEASFEAVFGATTDESLTALDAYPLEAALLLWIPGPIMPSGLRLFLLALLLAWRCLVPIWTSSLGDDDQLCSVPGPELHQQAADMGLDGRRGDVELLTNLYIGQATGDQSEDLDLPVG